MDDLFRQEAVTGQRPHLLGTVRLITPVSQQIWGIVAAAASIAIVLWLCMGHYTRRVSVAGSLVPNAGLLNVVARGAGTVVRLDVTAGEQVHADQALLTISGDRSSVEMGDTDEVVRNQLRAQIRQVQATLASAQPRAETQASDLRARVAMLHGQISQINAQLALQREQADTATRFVHKIEPVMQRGIVSTAQFDQYQANALTDQANVKGLERQRLDARQQISVLNAQLIQLPLDTAAKSNQLRSQLALNRPGFSGGCLV